LHPAGGAVAGPSIGKRKLKQIVNELQHTNLGGKERERETERERE